MKKTRRRSATRTSGLGKVVLPISLRSTAATMAVGLILAAPVGVEAKPRVKLVSRSASGVEANGWSYDPVTSRDGTYVAFESAASNLDPDDTDTTFDVFVRDMESGVTQVVSRASGPDGAKGDGVSVDPSISPDGRFVAFASEADNLAPGLPPGRAQVFVRDLQTGTTTLASRKSGPLGAVGAGFSSEPSFSDDGRFVAFQSTSNLDPDDRSWQDIYVRDLVAQTTVLASRASGSTGATADDVSFHPSISGDRTRVAFTSYATNLDPDQIPPHSAVFLRDLETGETTLESRGSGDPGEAGNSEAGSALLSADGKRVLFQSDSTNLVAGPEGPFSDVFSRRLEPHRTRILSRGLPVGKKKERNQAGSVSISDSGRRIAFAYQYEPKKRRQPDSQRVFLVDLRRDQVSSVRGIAGRVDNSSDRVQLGMSGNGRWLALQSTKRLHGADRDGSPDIFLVRIKG